MFFAQIAIHIYLLDTKVFMCEMIQTQLKKVKLRVHHTDCWSSKIIGSEILCKIIPTAVMPIKKIGKRTMTQQIWEISGSEEDIKNFFEHLKKVDNIKNSSLISLGKNRAAVSVIVVAAGSTYQKITDNKCAILSLTISNGFEDYELLVSERTNLEKLVSDLKELGDAKIISIKDFKETKRNNFDLTEKQNMALKTALRKNYYSWPRNVNLEEMAETMNMSRRAFQEHLRRAEAKIIPEMLKNSLEAM